MEIRRLVSTLCAGVLALALATAGCGEDATDTDNGSDDDADDATLVDSRGDGTTEPTDTSEVDSGPDDTGPQDSGANTSDTASSELGDTAGEDTSPTDTATTDTSSPTDTSIPDTSATDTSTTDTATTDASTTDTATTDTAGDGTDTSSAPLSACCLNSFTVSTLQIDDACVYTTKSECQNQGGTWNANSTCDSNPCSFGSQTGSCCILAAGSGACVNATQSACNSLPSTVSTTFRQNQSCSDKPCNFTTGGCCVRSNQACVESQQTACVGFGGNYQSSTTCSMDPC